MPPRRYGGSELVVSVLTKALVRAGHDVTLLASGGSRTAARLVTVHRTPPSADIGDPLLELHHVSASEHLSDVDVVHDHTLLGSALTAARGTVPVVHTLHGPFTERSRPVLARLGRTVDLVAISHDQAAHAPEVPLRGVVHNGLDLTRYGPGTGARGDGLIFLGRASPDKGPEVAIEVAHRTGRPLTMAIKVNEPAEQAYWDEVIAPMLGRADVTVVRDADHDTKVGLLRAAHALVAPIRWPEPFGLVLAEAGACGVPAIAFRRGAAGEIIEDGVTGRLVEPQEGVAGLVRAVCDVGTVDPAACLARVGERFSADALVAGYLAVYARAIDASRSPHRPSPLITIDLTQRRGRADRTPTLTGHHDPVGVQRSPPP